MSEYQLQAPGTNMVLRVSDGAFVPLSDPLNPDCATYLAWVAAGNEADPYEDPLAQVTSVTPRQARLALFAAGFLDQVDAAVKDAGGAVQLSWDYATQINRDDPLLKSVGASLGLTDEQIDLIFQQAATL